MVQKVSAVTVLLLVFFSLGGAWYIHANLQPIDLLSDREQVIVIPHGSNARAIGRLLQDAGLIRSAEFFALYSRVTGKASRLRTGSVALKSSMDLPRILDTLTASEIQQLPEIRITLPEGITLRQMAEKFSVAGLCSSEDFLEAAAALSWKGFRGGEGLLFPDTYFFHRGSTAEAMVRRIHKKFLDVFEQMADKTLPQGISIDQALVLASIVERECAASEERPKVAGVFLNRIARGMKLESCATVLYVAPPGTSRVTDRELAIDSPYNTYRVQGLPPGPICCPGRASIESVFNPVMEKWLYFVAAGDGTHHFSSTLREHNRYKLKLKQLLRKRSRNQ
ncbi:MAG: endolytic transglycosylase MltG [Candidatus Wallbacteria bacterium HGW-Wallbacteria-1]|jgi:UPF0755 protein|uniref:Endolytic murein transglycosylase n=1 Tax=Candidatus Wallbacteria bacterium HGW-Wallbacteria-1 TaxID=2013854 RepID=A0A2N1PTW4_9BACT|nr:MAG: endolytic transglycosylase MltG [Candidatus Wallbacteria bacterium HGW-Wallbacteria-1]